MSGEFPPGHALMTKVLAEDIGVSRTPVRDALRRLEVDGLVTVTARLGASVKTMDLNEFRELSGMRLALESHAAGLAAQNRTESDLQEIEIALNRMRELTERLADAKEESALFEELVREDVRFHLAVITAAKNALMKKEILRLHLINRIVSLKPSKSGTIDREYRNARRRDVLECHEEIFAALKNRDSASAKIKMEVHLQESLDHFLGMIARTSRERSRNDLAEDELFYDSDI